MPFGSQHKQPAEFLNRICMLFRLLHCRATKLNINPASGKVGRNCHCPSFPCLRDNLTLPFVILCVEYFVRHLRFLQSFGKGFIVIYRRSTDQHRLSFLMQFFHLRDNGAKFRMMGLINSILMVNTLYRLVRRHTHYRHFIHLIKFLLRRLCRPGHAGEFLVHPKIVLKGDRRVGARFLFYGYPFFRLNRLMDTITPLPPGLQSSGKLVNDNHLIIPYHILLIPLKQ